MIGLLWMRRHRAPFSALAEGIVSKRLDTPYRSGPSKTWLKSKNPLSEAVRREREERSN
jgi:ATP-dependent DNA ligase